MPPAVDGVLLPLLFRVGTLRCPLSVPGLGSAETASVTVDLDNAAGALSACFAQRAPMACCLSGWPTVKPGDRVRIDPP